MDLRIPDPYQNVTDSQYCFSLYLVEMDSDLPYDAHLIGSGFTTPAEFNLGPAMCTYPSSSSIGTLILKLTFALFLFLLLVLFGLLQTRDVFLEGPNLKVNIITYRREGGENPNFLLCRKRSYCIR